MFSAELREMNQQPVQETQSPFAPAGQEDDAAERQRKEKLLSQLPTGVERGKGYFWGWDVAVYKCKGKIVKYGEMAVVKCIFSFPHTILVEGETWILLNCLTVVCFVTMLICLYTGSAESMGISDVTGRVQLLLGFVLSGHVGQILSRWSQLRFNNFGPMWGGIENFCILIDQIFVNDGNEVATDLKQKSKRYCRLLMQLLFRGIQEKGDLSELIEDGLLEEAEKDWLEACPLNTRSLMVFGWLSRMWEDVKNANMIKNFNAVLAGDNALLGIKGGIGGTMGMLGCPLPYSYVHIVYWTVQTLLSILAIETGTLLAIFTKRAGNGNEEYSFDDGDHEWPENSQVWYLNEFIQVTCGNVIFALFTVGLLKVCDKLSNPFRDVETSFPSYLYDKALNNNVHAVAAGLKSYSEIFPDKIPKQEPPLLSMMQQSTLLFEKAGVVVPSRVSSIVAAWSPEEVSAWVGRVNDNKYARSASSDEVTPSPDKKIAYFSSTPAVYQDCASTFLQMGVSGQVLLSLTTEELAADFGMKSKYHRRAFMADLLNLQYQLMS